MRVVLCTSGGRPGAAVLQTLRSSGRVDIAGVVVSNRILTARYSFVRGVWEQYRLSGLRYSVYLGCAAFAPLGSGGAPRISTREINNHGAFVASLKPELIVCAFFNQRVGAQIMALAPSVNIHPSLLPAYKGVDPVFYARLRDAPLGVTVHRLSHELDSGEIVAQERVSVPADESVLATTVRLYARGARLLLDSAGKILARSAAQADKGSYYSWPTRSDVSALRRKGVRLVRARDLLARAP